MELAHVHAHPADLDDGDTLPVQIGHIVRLFQEGVGVATHNEINAPRCSQCA